MLTVNKRNRSNKNDVSSHENFFLTIKSTVSYKVSDHEGHGHKAIVYKSYFPPLRHSVVAETPGDINAPYDTKYSCFKY